MNKFNTLSWLGASCLLLSLASCTNDELPLSTGDKLTFNVTLPAGMNSRAFADGLNATNLNVAIYKAAAEGETSTEAPIMSTFEGGANANLITIEPAGNNRFTVSVPLARGNDYDVVFWAQSYENGDANSPYTFDAENKSIKVNYANMQINDNAADAFYAMEASVSGDVPANHDVTLTRPFAQVNIGAADYQEYLNAAGRDLAKSSLTFTKVPATFNIVTGKAVATDADADVTFAAANLPGNSETFPMSDDEAAAGNMKYIAMAYILAGDQTNAKGVSDVTLTVENGVSGTLSRNYNNIPVQVNYRTNIYGRILTNVNDFNVTINPMYAGATSWRPDVWDGTYVEPQQNENGDYIIRSANEFAGIILLWRDNKVTENTKFILTTDVDLQGRTWPMSTNTSGFGTKVYSLGTSAKPFKGEFDGQGHIIKGFGTINGTTDKKSIFAYTANVNIHDLTIEGYTVSYSVLIEQAGDNTTVENVNIRGGKNGGIDFAAYSSASAFGTIIGTVLAKANVTVKNCNNYANIFSSATGNSSTAKVGGGLVGNVKGNGVLTITGCNNYGNIDATATGGTIPYYGVGGILGFVEGNGTAYITDCCNMGEINWTTNRGFAGGILGFTSTSPSKVDYVITDCVNKGNINIVSAQQVGDNNSPYLGMLSAGGICGGSYNSYFSNYNGGKTIENCSNSGTLSVESQGYGSILTTSNGFKNNPERYGLYAGGIVGLSPYYYISITGCNNSGSLSATSADPTEGITAYQALAGIINTYANKNLILENNTVAAGVTMTGNHNPYIGAIYTWNKVNVSGAPSTFPTDAIITGNVNNTSYSESNR